MALALMAAVSPNPNADPLLWYLTRTFAVGAYITLFLTVVLGITRSLAHATNERVSWMLDELHIIAAILTGLLTAGHLLTLFFDPFYAFGLTNLLLPLSQPVSTLAVDLGVLALYALVALLLSSWLKPRISYAVWRAIHYASFAAFVLVTLHGWIAGTDSLTNWMPALYIGCSAGVAYLVGGRLLADDRRAARRRVVAGNGVPAALIAALVIAGIGPLVIFSIEGMFFTT